MFSREQVEQTISEDTETVYESTSKKSNCALEFVDKEGNPVEGISVKITDTNNKVVLEFLIVKKLLIFGWFFRFVSYFIDFMF